MHLIVNTTQINLLGPPGCEQLHLSNFVQKIVSSRLDMILHSV